MKDIKKIVQEKYGNIAGSDKKTSCCSCGCGSDESIFGIEYSVFNDDYSKMEGYVPEADLGLGCGLPTGFAAISKGETVVDLGSGAGNDCFVARHYAGEEGKVIGLDFTPEMIEKARKNNAKLGFTNIEFVEGDIENMPIDSGIADVVISNCVLNLVPDKTKAFGEIFRILKNRGRFCISDVVITGQLPESLKNDMVMYAGCVSGAIGREKYLDIIRKSGFENVKVRSEKVIDIPDDILKNYLDDQACQAFRNSGTGIFSITVTGEKPGIVVINNYNYAQDEM